MNEATRPYELKARESLAGAQSELSNGRYNNAASRAYFAAYQAAIVALIRAGYSSESWGHDEVQALLSGQLIGRRKLYPANLRGVLNRLFEFRVRADYELAAVSRNVAENAVRVARRLVETVLGG